MPKLQLSNPRRRQRTELGALQLKRQKLDYPTTESQPPAFWDSLSKIWLTKNALRESLIEGIVNLLQVSLVRSIDELAGLSRETSSLSSRETAELTSLPLTFSAAVIPGLYKT